MRGRLLPLAAVTAALAGVAAIVAIALLGGSDDRLVPPGGEPVAITTSITPERALFGDRLDASLSVTIDATRVDPATVEVAAFFRPFRRVGPIERTRTDLGDTVVLEYAYPIQCVDRGCVPAGGAEALELPVGVVRYAARGEPIASLPVTWPAVSLASRLSAEQLAALRAQPEELALDGDVDDPPPVAYGITPPVLGWLLVAVGALAVLAAGCWLAWRLRAPARAEKRTDAPAPELPPLAAAVEGVERALGDGDEAARRAALDSLALELGRTGQAELARGARRLAWSRAVPDGAAASQLLEEARRVLRDAA